MYGGIPHGEEVGWVMVVELDVEVVMNGYLGVVFEYWVVEWDVEEIRVVGVGGEVLVGVGLEVFEGVEV